MKIRRTENINPALESLPTNAFSERGIKTIAMVGARQQGDYLSGADAGYLASIFQICAEQKLLLAPKPEIDIINLEYGGEDFLKEPPQSDMVVFSYIFYEPCLIGVPRVNPYVRQSSMAAQDGVWHKALLKSGANVAFNVYEDAGDSELPTSFVARDPFTHRSTTACPVQNKNFDLLIR